MLPVFLTVDVEIWPPQWDLSHSHFRDYFARYIEGNTARGAYGLPFQLKLLREHGLKCVFFIESLFASHYGLAPLKDIVALVQSYGQEIALHVHTEWLVKANLPLGVRHAGINLWDYTEAEQTTLIRQAAENLTACGVPRIDSFRAGNYGANYDTLKALAKLGIRIDSSYNRAARQRPHLTLDPHQPTRYEGVTEYPVTLYRDGLGRLKSAQINGSSLGEFKSLLAQTSARRRPSFVMLWHSAELLNGNRSAPDPVPIRRFERLCAYLADHRQEFESRFFSEMVDAAMPPTTPELSPLVTPAIHALVWYGEQLVRRAFR